MRLLTHNTLKNIAKNVDKGFPLKLQVNEMKVISDYESKLCNILLRL